MLLPSFLILLGLAPSRVSGSLLRWELISTPELLQQATTGRSPWVQNWVGLEELGRQERYRPRRLPPSPSILGPLCIFQVLTSSKVWAMVSLLALALVFRKSALAEILAMELLA